MRLYYLILFFFLSVGVFVSSTLILKDPPIWPDESIYANVAMNIINEGRLGMDFWKDTLKGSEICACWYPPVYFYLLALSFKVFGFSILSQRLLSLIFGVGTIILFYLLGRVLLDKKEKNGWVQKELILAFSAGGLVFDSTFLRATRVGRPEIILIFFGIFSLYLFTLSRRKEIGYNLSLVLTAASGLMASLAFLTHTIGAFFVVSITLYFFLTERFKAIRSIRFYLLSVSFLIPIFFWIISILPYLDIVREQMSLAALRKGVEEAFIVTIFKGQSLSSKILYISYFAITVIFSIFFLAGKGRHLLLTLALFISWVFILYGKMFWYYSLPLLFIYLAVAVLIFHFSQIKQNNQRHFFLTFTIMLLAIIFFINFRSTWDSVNQLSGEKYSYQEFTDSLLGIIPENKTVFLSSIPDAYYGFATRGENNIYQFPVLQTDHKNYIKLLDDTDFIIYSGTYNGLIFGDLLNNYIKSNSKKIYQVGEKYQYQALVIELVPKDQRTVP